MALTSVCAFCGSRPGQGERYLEAARAFGRAVATRGLTLVYGGGSIGLMGAVSDAAVDAGGRVVGVIPDFLDRREVANRRISELIIVRTMHERKAKMAELADAFAALPGGIGTLEETFEIWTWNQLGTYSKPLGFLDVDGYYRPLLGFMDHVVATGFLPARDRAAVPVEAEPEALLDALAATPQPPPAGLPGTLLA